MRNRIYLTSVKRFGLSRWEEYNVVLIINVLGLIRKEPDPWRGSNPGTQPLLLRGKEDYLYQISVVFQAGCLKCTSFEQTWIPFTRGCVVSSTVEICPCWEVVNFAHHFPLETFLPLGLSDYDRYLRRLQGICLQLPPRWRRGRAFASHAGERGSIPGRDRPKS